MSKAKPIGRFSFGTLAATKTLNDRFAAINEEKKLFVANKRKTSPQIESNPFWKKNEMRGQTIGTFSGDCDYTSNGRIIKIEFEDEEKENAESVDVIRDQMEKKIIGLSTRKEIQLAEEVKHKAHLRLLLNEKKVFRGNTRYRGLNPTLEALRKPFGNRLSFCNRSPLDNKTKRFGNNYGSKGDESSKELLRDQLDYDLEMYMSSVNKPDNSIAA